MPIVLFYIYRGGGMSRQRIRPRQVFCKQKRKEIANAKPQAAIERRALATHLQ